jgi:arylsulfatase A-like enzyme
VTLAERFASAGYQTAAFTDGAVVGEDWNLLQGFEHVEAKTEGVAAKVDQALEFLANDRDDRPMFLFLHTYQVHMPYTAPEYFASLYDPDYEGVLLKTDRDIRTAWNERGELPPLDLLKDQSSFKEPDLEYLVALYHGELTYTDRELGRLWSRLEKDRALGKSVVAVTADHGEEFGEHGQIGHRQLYQETLHVPLIVRLPDRDTADLAGRRVQGRVGLIDLHDFLLTFSETDSDSDSNPGALMAAARGESSAHITPNARTDCTWERTAPSIDRCAWATASCWSVLRTATCSVTPSTSLRILQSPIPCKRPFAIWRSDSRLTLWIKKSSGPST